MTDKYFTRNVQDAYAGEVKIEWDYDEGNPAELTIYNNSGFICLYDVEYTGVICDILNGTYCKGDTSKVSIEKNNKDYYIKLLINNGKDIAYSSLHLHESTIETICMVILKALYAK